MVGQPIALANCRPPPLTSRLISYRYSLTLDTWEENRGSRETMTDDNCSWLGSVAWGDPGEGPGGRLQFGARIVFCKRRGSTGQCQPCGKDQLQDLAARYAYRLPVHASGPHSQMLGKRSNAERLLNGLLTVPRPAVGTDGPCPAAQAC